MSSTTSKQLKFKITQPNLLCKTPSCQYYGNEVQEGFCSLCYKDYKQKQLQRSSRADHRSHNSRTPGSVSSNKSNSNRSFENSYGETQQQSYLFGSGNNNTNSNSSSSPAASALSAFATLPRAAAAKLSFDSISLLPSPISSFTKFEEKKKSQIEKKSASFRSVFRRSPTRSPVKSPDLPPNKLSPFSNIQYTNSSNASSSGSSSPRSHFRMDIDFENLREEFNEFLKPFPIPIKRDVTVKVKECANELKKLTVEGTVSEFSDITQNFYTNFRKKVDTLPIYKNLELEEKDKLMDFIERYFTLNFYKEFFSPISTAMEDEMKDLELQKKIRQLNWTSTEHLDINLNERDKEVREMIWSAITSIVEMDSVKPPQEKLKHISQCCRHIMEALGKSKQAPASADDFLPALIYIVIKANPTRLQSNINYITRFSNANRLMSGEAGYFFTNLCCAVTFIQGLNADSLNMAEEEFQSYMSGKSVPPPGSWEMHFSESLHTVQEMSKELNGLETRHYKLLDDVQELKNTMEEGRAKIATDVEGIIQRTPLKFKPRKLPVKFDEMETSGLEDPLPSPLKPQVVSLTESSPQSPLSGVPVSNPDQTVPVSAIYVHTDAKSDLPHQRDREPQSVEKTHLSTPGSEVLEGSENASFEDQNSPPIPIDDDAALNSEILSGEEVNLEKDLEEESSCLDRIEFAEPTTNVLSNSELDTSQEMSLHSSNTTTENTNQQQENGSVSVPDLASEGENAIDESAEKNQVETITIPKETEESLEEKETIEKLNT